MADCKESKEEADGPQPPVIMKFDAPDESSDNSSDNSSNDKTEERESTEIRPQRSYASSSHKIRYPILSASKFGNSFGVLEFSKFAKPKQSLLRPSQLNAVTGNPGPLNKSVLQPAKFQNPFAKVNDDSIVDDNGTSKENDKDPKAEEVKDKEGDDKSEGKKDNRDKDSENDGKQAEERAKPKFLPLEANAKDNENSVNINTAAPSVPSASSASSFVFGQNLKERVTVSNDTGSDSSEKEGGETKEEVSENGSSELLFSNAAVVCRSTSQPGLTLSQAAQELEEANRANKRKYSQVTLLTGEEGETNVLQINCKLFAFDKATSGWQERGRGTLRLNDRDEESRLVGRTAGTQRLILNTKVWSGMTAERAGPKSLRLTAMDVHGDIRIFIVQAAPKEVDQLHNLLLQRLERAQERQPKKLATDH